MRGEVKRQQSLDINKTDDKHIPGRVHDEWEKLYRNPIQPSIDGNTVDENLENKEFTTNAMSYNSSFEFLNRKFSGLTRALKGDR